MQVCTRLRRIVTQIPELWTSIHAGRQDWHIKTYIKRAGLCPLNISGAIGDAHDAQRASLLLMRARTVSQLVHEVPDGVHEELLALCQPLFQTAASLSSLDFRMAYKAILGQEDYIVIGAPILGGVSSALVHLHQKCVSLRRYPTHVQHPLLPLVVGRESFRRRMALPLARESATVDVSLARIRALQH